MSSVLNNATTHFKDILAQSMQSVEIAEWNTTVFFRPATSFAQEQNVIKLHSEGKMVEALVETLINRACDADGKRLFKLADKTTLMNEVDPQVILKVVNAMNGAGVDEAELGN
jgi:hypothetical protein